MGGQAELTGPDLTAGVPESQLTEGGMVLGHAAGEAVLLARSGGEVFALGATCSHYGGPLAEGLVVGDTVRCPWHHACFSLRTGEALRAPALNDVSVWRVERRDGSLFVTGKGDGSRPRAQAATRPEGVGIVGGGAAGNAAAEMLRRSGYAGEVVMFDAEQASPYDRPNLSKDYLAGNAPEEWIPLHPPEFYREHEIEIVRTRVSAIDVSSRTVRAVDGAARSFGALLLAPGAEPVRLPIADDTARIHYLRSLDDSRAIIAAADGAQRAVVIGASFIGLEVAASLRQRDVAVHVVAPEAVPLARIVGDDLGRFVRALHEEKGVTFQLGRTVKRASGSGVELDDGTTLAADFIVIGAGVRPRLELARAAGLDVDDGIIVDAYLQTSATGVWAAGDAARWPDPSLGRSVRIEHWVVAERMGQTAARNILGANEPFTAVPFFWSQHYDAVIAYIGHAPGFDEAKLDGDPHARDCAVTFRLAGRDLALATIFRDHLSLETEAMWEVQRARAHAKEGT
jgi:NADPH-dependent 2,4-dienoyl-CoA reductase/sulfur reductase-like enzyme/nitrite reductase/ring-hydroxylating ferredoxin subunit